jgi:hydroxylamine reductase
MEGLFTTVTNVNFDPQRIAGMIYRVHALKQKLQEQLQQAGLREKLPDSLDFTPAANFEELIGQAPAAGVLSEPGLDPDIQSLREILLYGLKGMAAYADHAFILGKEDEQVSSFFYKGLSALADDSLTAEDYIGLIMDFGRANLKCMEILDEAHREHFGDPEPSEVILGTKKGAAIIVSGHDLYDLEQLLEQTEGKGINIYTHGEMLPAHGYPKLKAHKHLAGHFGTAWQNQQKEFDNLPAAILFTTNCIQKPRDSYKDRVFTTGLVAWEGISHIEPDGRAKKDFAKVIERALSLGGFSQDSIDKKILVGFGHNAILSSAAKIIEAVKLGKIRHFFLIGGCDGAKPGRNYYTEFAQKVPGDCLILTLACGKFRFNSLDFGTVAGLPRLLDCGQCNDAYSAIKVALALSEAFGCSVNELPLSLVLSWYEQKAVCILLTLLSLGVKNIRLGPTLPAFISPNVLKILVEKFNIAPVKTPDEDLKAILRTGAKVSE